MTRLSADKKRAIQGGIAFWTAAMGIAFIVTTVIGMISTIINVVDAYTPKEQTENDNSWATNYNRSSGQYAGVTMSFAGT